MTSLGVVYAPIRNCQKYFFLNGKPLNGTLVLNAYLLVYDFRDEVDSPVSRPAQLPMSM